MIRHAVVEGLLLLRQRAAVSLVLACALAVPIGLAGVTAATTRWLAPAAELRTAGSVVPVLLHPQMDDGQRRQWIEQQRAQHSEWSIEEVPPEQLAERLTRWFPYLSGVLSEDGSSLLPPMVEISTTEPRQIDDLRGSPAVIAVGPTTSVQRLLGRAAGILGVLFGGISIVLLVAAAMLVAVWVHLELYRHGDEITIMRLVGAAEWAVRGPFLVAAVAPGVVAGAIAVLGTVLLTQRLSEVVEVLGLRPLNPSSWLLVAEAVVAILLPLLAAVLTLRRHAAAA